MGNSLEMWKYKFSIVSKEGMGTFVKVGDKEIPVSKDANFFDVLEQLDDLDLEGWDK